MANDYRGRLVYELLQNADDAMEDQIGPGDQVAFLVTDDGLWMANTGRPLTDADVSSVFDILRCSSGQPRRRAAGDTDGSSASLSEICQMGRTFWASSPLRPWPTSNSTFWPSLSDLCPSPWMFEK